MKTREEKMPKRRDTKKTTNQDLAALLSKLEDSSAKTAKGIENVSVDLSDILNELVRQTKLYRDELDRKSTRLNSSH